MMSRRDSGGLFSLQTTISTGLIIVGVVISVVICLLAFNVPCLNNFYTQLPVYPDAELVDSTAGSLNYLGFGETVFVYHSTYPEADVQSWYLQTVEGARSEAIRAQARGEDAPPTWDHDYRISTTSTGEQTEIRLVATCLG